MGDIRSADWVDETVAARCVGGNSIEVRLYVNNQWKVSRSRQSHLRYHQIHHTAEWDFDALFMCHVYEIHLIRPV